MLLRALLLALCCSCVLTFNITDLNEKLELQRASAKQTMSR